LDILNAILNSAVLAVIIIGGLLLKGYLPSYAREKGKNLATKEDIEVITDKVEAVLRVKSRIEAFSITTK